MREPAGWGLVMTDSSFMQATGRENAAGWTTITAGTMTTTGIGAAGMTVTIAGTTAMTEAATGTTTIETTKSIQDSPEAYVAAMATRKFTLPAIVRS